jgi:hypothetical protein
MKINRQISHFIFSLHIIGPHQIQGQFYMKISFSALSLNAPEEISGTVGCQKIITNVVGNNLMFYFYGNK